MQVNVTINTQRVGKDGRCQVIMYVSLHGRARYVFPFRVEPSQWNEKLRRVRSGGNASHFNRTIQDTVSKAEVIALETGMTAAVLVTRLGSAGAQGRSLYEVARERLEQLGPAVGYNTRLQKLSALRVIERIAPSITLEGLDHPTVERIQTALLRQCSVNTTTYKLKRFEAMWNDAVGHYGLERPSPFKRLKKRLVKTAKKGLFPDQMQRVIDVDLSGVSPFVQLSRKLYVLQYLLAGMRWADLCRAHTGWFSSGMLVYTMHKTSKLIQWSVTPMAREIMAELHGEPFGNERFIAPILKANMQPNDPATYARINYMGGEVNKALKVVAMLAKVPPITTHWARHSHGVKARLSGVDNAELQESMGHGSGRITEEYVKQLEGTMHLSAFKKMHG